jgi:ADP-ribose pyrophosphatase YjhB (NUDIX family)
MSPDLMQATKALRSTNHHTVSIATSIAEMAAAIFEQIGSGARRVGSECDIPLPIWKTDSFQRWYHAQTAAGNRLLGARLVWTFNIDDNALLPLYWALHVRIHIQSEDRAKTNEVVISRPDISVMTLYQPALSMDDTIIVLIREFRSPASTPDGLVHELPGGSRVGNNALDQAIREVEEEVGLSIEAQRVRKHSDRQLAATTSAHQAHLFAVEITGEELLKLRSRQSVPDGQTSDTERTWTEITTFREIRQNRLVDWATLGMISEILLDRYSDPAK